MEHIAYMSLVYGEGEDNAMKRLKKKAHETEARSQDREKRHLATHSWLCAPDPINIEIRCGVSLMAV